MPVTLSRSDVVTVLDLGDDENRMSPDWLDLVGEALDEVVASAPGALVTTASGKFFSNGLDLEWLGEHLDEYDAYLGRVQGLMARFLTLPVPTLAAISGHAFGMGAVLALTHDTRTMRTDRGYFCFPEVDLGLQFTPFMMAVIRATLPPVTGLEASTTGRRYGGPDALAAGIVQDLADVDVLRERSCARLQQLATKDASTLGAIKEAIHGDLLTLVPRTAGTRS